MKITTKFDIGDVVFRIVKNEKTKEWSLSGPLTIGQVSVTIIDSPGILGEDLFDNYKPQKDRKENYMMVETGIGSGTMYNADDLFTEREVLWRLEEVYKED